MPEKSHNLAITSLVKVYYYEHPKIAHVDPKEEIHDEYNLIFTEQGSWGYRDKHGKQLITPKVIVFGKPDLLYSSSHTKEVPDDCCFDIKFNEKFICNFFQSQNINQIQFSFTPVTPKLLMLKERIKRIIDFDVNSIAIDEISANILYELFNNTNHKSLPPLPLAKKHKESIEAAKEFIQQHFHDNLSLQNIATTVGLSPYHFCRLFKKITDITPYQFLLKTRLQKAATLLLNTKSSVTDISYDAGFDNLSLFINSFRKRYGISPLQYRKNN